MIDKSNHNQRERITPSWASLFQTFFNLSIDGLWIIDRQGRFIDVNAAYCQMTGYSREELLSMSIAQLEARETPELIDQHIKDIIPTGRARFETTHRRKDGTAIEVEVSATYFDRGHEDLFLVFIRDLTEHKRMEARIQHRLAVEKAMARVSRLFVSPDHTDLQEVLRIMGQIVGVNRAYIFQFRQDNQKMDNTFEWCDPDTEPQIGRLQNIDTCFFTWSLEKLSRGENMVISDINTLSPEAVSEQRFAQTLGARSVLAVPIQAMTGRLLGIMGFDNSRQEREWSDEDIQALRVVAEMVGISWEHKRAQEEKENIQIQLLQAQKMEAIGLLTGGIAHDFNNRLTTIQGYAGLGLKRVQESDPVYRDLSQIQRAAGRAADLTRQLLIFSRKKPTVLVPHNLNLIADNLMHMLKSLMGEDIIIDIDLQSDLWPVRADEANMEQVIMNLAVNARDAMPRGGRMIMKTENVTLDEAYVHLVPEARPGRFVRLSVADTGIGMEKEIMDQIFEPFFTTKDPGRGTGLGLSVVYGIIKQHRGWIHVYSESGNGSIFKIYLPAISERPIEKPEENMLQSVPRGQGERILLVEDNEGVRELTREALLENGYFVLGAVSAHEAMNIFEKEDGRFHLIICDVVLPDLNGPELIYQFLTLRQDLAVILISGYTDQRVQCPAISRKRCQFIQKPYSLDSLLRIVRDIIEPE